VAGRIRWRRSAGSPKLGLVKFNSLTFRILAGLALGLTIGGVLAALHPPWRGQAIALADGLGNVWLDALRMTIVPLVFSLLFIAVAQAAGTVRAGGLAARALIIFGVLLLISSALGAVATPLILQVWPPPAAAVAALRVSAAGAASGVPASPPLAEWLGSFVPSNPVKAAADGAMAAIAVFALFFGLAAARQDEPRRAALYVFFDAVQATMMTIVGWVLWAAPAGVFLLSLAVGAKVGASAVGLLGQYVIIISLLCLASGAMGLVAALLGGRVGFGPLIAALAPVEAMAVSTQSSLASLPVMLEACEKLGVPEKTRDLVLPMAVALFRITSPAANMGVVIYVAHIYGVPLDPLKLAAGVVVSALVSLAAVGVASSVTFFVTLVPISATMGVPIDLLPLLLPVETLPDFSRTIGNVTGDVGVTAWAARWRGARPPTG
jgi:proton glutamate symport protein